MHQTKHNQLTSTQRKAQLKTHYSYNIKKSNTYSFFLSVVLEFHCPMHQTKHNQLTSTQRKAQLKTHYSYNIKKSNTYSFFLSVVLEFHCPMHQTKHNQLTSTQKKAQLRWKETGVQNPYTQKLLQICLH